MPIAPAPVTAMSFSSITAPPVFTKMPASAPPPTAMSFSSISWGGLRSGSSAKVGKKNQPATIPFGRKGTGHGEPTTVLRTRLCRMRMRPAPAPSSELSSASMPLREQFATVLWLISTSTPQPRKTCTPTHTVDSGTGPVMSSSLWWMRTRPVIAPGTMAGE
jgi:hypothetical protein